MYITFVIKGRTGFIKANTKHAEGNYLASNAEFSRSSIIAWTRTINTVPVVVLVLDTIFLENPSFLNYKPPFLEALFSIISSNVFPTQFLPTFAAVDVANWEKTSNKFLVLRLPQNDVHRMSKHVSLPGFRLWNKQPTPSHKRSSVGQNMCG